MDKLAITGKWLYATAFLVFGIQHFMYAQFVGTLVPAFIPWRLFCGIFVGVAFVAFAVSVFINKLTRLSGMLLAVLMLLFVLLIHIPTLFTNPQSAQSWTRAMQDITIMGTALMLTGDLKLQPAGRYLFAVPMFFLGAQHFAHANFVTAKVPDWLAPVTLWDYVVGVVIILAAMGIISNRYRGVPALILGIFLLVFALLHHLPILVPNVYNGQEWTGIMIDIAVASGALVLAALPVAYYKTVPWQLNTK
nr:hypothetical protein [uncultured Mucilaginibacter sp.]